MLTGLSALGADSGIEENGAIDLDTLLDNVTGARKHLAKPPGDDTFAEIWGKGLDTLASALLSRKRNLGIRISIGEDGPRRPRAPVGPGPS